MNGNKRASVRLTDLFLGLNGRHLTGGDDDLFELVMDAATRKATEEETAASLRSLIDEGSLSSPFEQRYPEVIERLAHA